MEIIRELSNQYVLYIPTALVIFGAILVFTFGFKSPEQPPFNKLSSDDRKSTGKKRKIKEKKSSANGHVSTGEARHDKSPAKEPKRSPNKEAPEPKQEKKEKKLDNKQVEKTKKNEVIKSNIIEEAKSKKNNKKATVKPVDFDEGDWETVPLKSDKKKKEQSPAKKEKKPKKASDKVDKVEIEKLVKEVVNKELRELDRDIKEEITIEKVTKKEENLVIEEPVVVVEEKKDKKKEKKAKKEVVEEHVAPPAESQEKETVKETVKSEKKIEKTESAPAPKAQSKEAAPVFDELGDVWTEAKAAKKSKKKARRDN
uniref:Uncharacterized protein n=1 Tax=Anoplophora glabripennis TaxID=217634 RepID=V5I8L8_ANOGL